MEDRFSGIKKIAGFPAIFLFAFDANYLSALVIAAVLANVVRPTHMAAVAAGNHIAWAKCVMGAAAITATL